MQYNLPQAKSWHPRIKSICTQIVKLISSVCLRMPPLSIADAVAMRCGVLSSLAAAEAAVCEEEAKTSRKESWEKWLDSVQSRSAAAGHKFVNDAVKTVYDGPQLADAKCRSVLIAEHRDFWNSYWDPVEKQELLPDLGPVPVLPDLTRQELISASKSFPTKTTAMGGFHPR